MSHTIHIHRSVISSPSKMSSTRPITNQWAAVVSRRKLQLACDGQGRKDVNILHRLVLVSNFARAHQDECTPPPAPPPPSPTQADWLDAILQELEEEAEVMVSCLPPDEECNASSSDAPVEDEDVIVCDSYFSYVYAPRIPPPIPPLHLRHSLPSTPRTWQTAYPISPSTPPPALSTRWMSTRTKRVPPPPPPRLSTPTHPTTRTATIHTTSPSSIVRRARPALPSYGLVSHIIRPSSRLLITDIYCLGPCTLSSHVSCVQFLLSLFLS
ncbi:hypothetical protein RHS01_02636 [Rhizoctonia solani]|uniref:Uncharacterized protein n=1 Tax=Rhizoctonia solani TaxID=456999 RepID=A0A8H7IJ48_9AGAM|nr:hypothetical protein RHS01_02636 [Rhizoctonia solani]